MKNHPKKCTFARPWVIVHAFFQQYDVLRQRERRTSLKKLFENAIRKKKTVIILFLCAAVVSAFLMLGVGQNFDMSEYLPAHSDSKIGIDILKDEYSYNGSALMMLENKSIVEVLGAKERLEDISGIEAVVWLDDVADLKQPVELIDEEVRNNYYNSGNALLQIVFTEDDYSNQTQSAIDNIKGIFGDDVILSGSAMDAYMNIKSINGNMMGSISIALGITLIILFLTTNSIAEVILFLLTMGVAVLLNLGTNVIFGKISYMTFACAAILQLAVSMDYSIFLLHRFSYERQTESDPAKAMVRAQRASFASIMSSGATTIVGFLALVFMSYTMGADMGLVLAKGIVLSLLCVMLLLPVLAVLFVKFIDKTTHKPLLPSLKRVQHMLGGKVKYVVIGVLILVSVISYMAQNNNTFMYSSSDVGDAKQTEMNAKIQNTFGESNNFVVLVPRGSETSEYDMVSKLETLDTVKSVQGIYAFIDPATPQEIVPDYLRDEFLSENYSRYIVEVDTPIESEEATQAVEQIRQVAAAYFEQPYVTGASPVIYDIAQTTSGDFSLVTILSMIFVGLIILVTFRSLTVPVILLFIIETSIWINMAIPYFQGIPMIFLGYMIVSAVQLGATIDYAILMTNYYLEGRKTLDKRGAADYAVEKAGASIMVSALVLATAGFVFAGSFTQAAMAQFGTLIGRGALLSGFLTIFVLPQLLITLDGVIKKTTLKRKLFRGRQQDEI